MRYKNEELYQIPDKIKNFPKLKILRQEKDLGPLMKILPAIEFLRDRKKEPNAIVISIDDDTAYPAGMIGQIVKEMSFHPNSSVGASAPNIDMWKLEEKIWPKNSSQLILEGFGGIGYKVKNTDTEIMKKIVLESMEQGDKSCYLSDDLVINYVLSKRGIDKQIIKNSYYNIDLIYQLSFGFGEDALHRNDGSAEHSLQNTNQRKYNRCLNFIEDNKDKFF